MSLQQNLTTKFNACLKIAWKQCTFLMHNHNQNKAVTVLAHM